MAKPSKPTNEAIFTSTADQIAGTVRLAALSLDHPDCSDEELDQACRDALSDCFDPIKVAIPSPKTQTGPG